jgi:hypothetical protein
MRRLRHGRQSDRSKNRRPNGQAATRLPKVFTKSHFFLLQLTAGTGKLTARRPMFYR